MDDTTTSQAAQQNISASDNNWLHPIILITIFFLFGLFPTLLFNLSKDNIKKILPKPTTVQTNCFKFIIPSIFKYTINNSQKCEVELAVSTQSVRIKPIMINREITEADLKKIVAIQEQELTTNPKIKINKEGHVKFAGLTGYGFEASLSENKSSIFFLYDPKASGNVDGQKVRGYAIGITSGSNLPNLIKEIENSWEWKEVNKSQVNSNNDPFTVVTPCYVIKSQVVAKQTYKVNDCDLSLQIGEDSDIVGIHQFSQSDATLIEAVNDWKKSNNNNVVISEKDIKIDSTDGHQIIFKSSQASDVIHTVFLVYTGNRYQSVFNYPVNGFEIVSLYGDERKIKSNIDYLLLHWTWL